MEKPKNNSIVELLRERRRRKRMEFLEMQDNRILSTGERVEQVVLHVILAFLALCALLPFILLVSSSLTSESSVLAQGFNFWPRDFDWYAYYYLFITSRNAIIRAYGISMFITVVGTGLTLFFSPMLAYAISRKDYKRAGVISFYVFFSIIFNGGIVPQFLMWTTLFGINNTIWALVFPNLLINGFLLMIARNYFRNNIHPAFIEAAKIDGASEWQIYFKIVMPQSMPILAILGLMVGLNYWNDWVNGLYYITDPTLYSLQVLLSNILLNAAALAEMGDAAIDMHMPATTVRMAIAVIGVIPIMTLFPFFQKYFVKGITIGGVKE